MALAPDLVGTQSEPVSYAWGRDDVLLYALSVGAGQEDPTTELALTTENTEGIRTAVLPTYATIITRGARPELGDYDQARLVHAEQSFLVHRTIPVEGRARVTATVTDVDEAQLPAGDVRGSAPRPGPSTPSPARRW